MGAQSSDLSSSPDPAAPADPAAQPAAAPAPALFPAPISILDGNHSGWKIFTVLPDSPCSSFGLIPYFDILTHVNGVRLTESEAQLMENIREEIPTQLTVFSLATREIRLITVIPHRRWGGGRSGLLGLMIHFTEDFSYSDYEAIHCLEVAPGGAAEKAGIESFNDYLLGTSKVAFKDWSQLDSWIAEYRNQTASVYVFNAARGSVREVYVELQATMGCNMGQGYKHRMPIVENMKVVVEPPVGKPAAVAEQTNNTQQQQQQQGHGHSHGGQPCHGHGNATVPATAPAAAAVPVRPPTINDHGHALLAAAPIDPALASAYQQYTSTPAARQYAQAATTSQFATVDMNAPAQPAPVQPVQPQPQPQSHGHSHGGQPCHGHGHAPQPAAVDYDAMPALVPTNSAPVPAYDPSSSYPASVPAPVPAPVSSLPVSSYSSATFSSLDPRSSPFVDFNAPAAAPWENNAQMQDFS